MIIYLYVKTHRVTGLKYLGKTNARDPHAYPGSGIYWKRHLEEHGYNVHTEILHECTTDKEVRKLGLYYSNLWDVVNSKDEHGRKIWANLRPEEGTGGWGGEQNPNNLPHVKEERSQRLKVDNPVNFPGVKEKIRKTVKKTMSDHIVKERHLNGIHSEKWISARKERVGIKAPNYDKTIYTFENIDGRVIQCTQFELGQMPEKPSGHKLVNGKLKTSKGWRIKKL